MRAMRESHPSVCYVEILTEILHTSFSREEAAHRATAAYSCPIT